MEKVKSVNTYELYKLQRSIIFGELHEEKALVEISEKFLNNCYESPNAFWSREKYCVTPFQT